MLSIVESGFKSARAIAGVSILYRRPSSGETVTLTALPGSSAFGFEVDGITKDEIHTEDYLILASELILDSVQVTPEHFDEIDVDGRTVAVFDNDSTHWRFADQFRAVIRVSSRGVN